MSHRSRIRRQRWRLLEGDSLELLGHLPSAAVDALVTDPPAGIGFMGKAWDKDKGGRNTWISWLSRLMAECYRVLKPGAHGLVWALPRTSHWTAMALEDAGFEIRDIITHLFGTGFPKSLNLEGGLGTALKPAAEHWILVRKPCLWSVARNVERYDTGALNIEASRVGPGRWPPNVVLSHSDDCILVHRYETRAVPKQAFSFKAGSKTTNHEVVFDGEDIICSDECPVKLLDAQSGPQVSGTAIQRNGGGQRHGGGYGIYQGSKGLIRPDVGYGDVGGASRFLYCAKPDRTERDLGCDHLPRRTGGELTGRKEGSAGLKNPRAGAGRSSGGHNLHPTVKPLRLMRWLCRLITPPGGLVLDPFAGSGTTGAAATAEGFRFLGMEESPEYAAIARARLSYAVLQPDRVPTP